MNNNEAESVFRKSLRVYHGNFRKTNGRISGPTYLLSKRVLRESNVTLWEARDFYSVFPTWFNPLWCNTIFGICRSSGRTRDTYTRYIRVWTMCSCNLTLETSTRCRSSRRIGIFFFLRLPHREKGSFERGATFFHAHDLLTGPEKIIRRGSCNCCA